MKAGRVMTLFHLNRLANRKKKPRSNGLTMVIDPGVGIRLFQDYLELAADYIDYIKLGFGTLSITPIHIIEKKLALAEKYQVNLYPGGTFFECFAVEGREEYYFQQLSSIGFSWVEISDGTISLEPKKRVKAIQTAKSMGLNVITEIGKKKAGLTLSPQPFMDVFWADVSEGAAYILVEGRESGENIGVFNKEGTLDIELVDQICQNVTVEKLIWESPKKAQQIQFIKRIGNHVNLGNISFKDILSLESLRRGLRSDTFRQ